MDQQILSREQQEMGRGQARERKWAWHRAVSPGEPQMVSEQRRRVQWAKLRSHGSCCYRCGAEPGCKGVQERGVTKLTPLVEQQPSRLAETG